MYIKAYCHQGNNILSFFVLSCEYTLHVLCIDSLDGTGRSTSFNYTFILSFPLPLHKSNGFFNSR